MNLRAFSIVLMFLLLAASLLAPASTSLAASSADSPFGLNTHLATRFPHAGELGGPAGLVAQLGTGWVREDFAWPRLEPRQGMWNWGFVDEMVAEHLQHGVQILGRLGYSVGWATTDATDPADGQSFAMPDLEAWRGYVATTAGRYRGRVKAWEIWNEPDNPIYWNGQPDPRAYAQLLRVAHDAIKSADPAALVVLGGVSPFDTSFLEGLAQAGAWNAFDILAIHPYTDPVSPEQGQIGPSGVGGVRAMTGRYGDKPIWATEFGWESAPSARNLGVDEERQASYLVRGYLQLLAEPGLKKAFWYTLHDDTASPFGLVRFGGGYGDYSSQKPSFQAFATMTHQLDGAHFVSMVDLAAGRQIVEGWERDAGWVRAGPENGTLSSGTERVKDGSRAGRYDYHFGSPDNDYVAWRPAAPLEVGTPSAIGLWVSGDNSGHLLQLQLEDQGGELLQFPLGKVGSADWSWMQAAVSDTATPGNRLGGGNNNGRIDGTARVRALVIDDQPNGFTGAGTVWVDDLTAISGPEAYGYRWQRGSETIDVVVAPGGATVRIPTASPVATVVDRAGGRTEVAASGGSLTIQAGEQPRYIHHTPGEAVEPPPPAAPAPVGPVSTFVAAPADPAFSEVWNRTDAAVDQGQAARSWTWGPASFATGREDYVEAADGSRLVQYWDKSRMEVTNPEGNRADLWFVTNGLLSKELISGKLQIGNSAFVDRGPAEVPVAGDPDDPSAPMYASFAGLASLNGDRRTSSSVGSPVTGRIDRIGRVIADGTTSGYGVHIGAYDVNLGHNIPAVFVDYFKTMPLDWVFVLGYPITEPYWTTVRVGGVPKDVLIQVFERRALTFTPGNAPAFRVEMGNVGQHYFRWRYGSSLWER